MVGLLGGGRPPRQRLAALAALGPNLAQTDVDAQLAALALDERKLGGGVGREGVDGDDAGQAVDVLDVVNVLEEVRQTLSRASRFSLFSSALGTPPWYLRGADGGDDDDGVGMEAGGAALDVEELLGAEVGGEALPR